MDVLNAAPTWHDWWIDQLETTQCIPKAAYLGVFKDLKDQKCRFGAKGFVGSPDRVDALVWAISSLMLQNNGPPRIHQF